MYEYALTITARQQIYDQLHPGQVSAASLPKFCSMRSRSFANIPGWRCASPAWSGRTPFGLVFRRRGRAGFIGSQCLGRAEVATVPAVRSSRLSTPDDYTNPRCW
ncbi:hypothetical protein LNP17_22820 [Klebsiella variicola subsp. variicola]|nr:hypothetical protein [Klebsiella variicola subsp. variicola]